MWKLPRDTPCWWYCSVISWDFPVKLSLMLCCSYNLTFACFSPWIYLNPVSYPPTLSTLPCQKPLMCAEWLPQKKCLLPTQLSILFWVLFFCSRLMSSTTSCPHCNGAINKYRTPNVLSVDISVLGSATVHSDCKSHGLSRWANIVAHKMLVPIHQTASNSGSHFHKLPCLTCAFFPAWG